MPDFVNDNRTGAEFEASVRHVVRQLYRHAHTSGSIILDGRERDDIIDTGTELIVVEATKLKALQKIEKDLHKSIELVKSLRRNYKYSDYNFRIIIVTAEDPTADQAAHVKGAKAGCPKEIISYTELFSRLFDARHYIRLRGDTSFGSIRNPANDSDFIVPASDYIPTSLSLSNSGASLKARDLAIKSPMGGRYVIYGEYGSGKSMTMRDIYFKVRDQFVSGSLISCPVYLNLREHIAQTQPDVVLYAHAQAIGFPNPHSLVSAWRAGFITLFLDGFDELTPPQFASSVSNLKQARKFAVEIVLRFIEQTPKHAAIYVAGRENYFDGDRNEAQKALGYDKNAEIYDLAGFTDLDVQRFLKTKAGSVPSWLPTRPLLLGYLANAGLLAGKEDVFALDPASGWDQMLQRVCEREVNQIWGVGFESDDLRLFIERLATHERKSLDGRGIDDSGLRSVFRSVFGRDMDEPANLLTMRLPGLGSIPGRPGAREFVDADFADAAASGDLARYINTPFAKRTPLEDVAVTLGDLGRQMAVARIVDEESKVSIALNQSAQKVLLSSTTADLMSILIDQQSGYSGPELWISDAIFENIAFDPELNFSNITLAKCTIGTLELGRSSASKDLSHLPRFRNCEIDRLEGALSAKDVPEKVLDASNKVKKYAAFTATNDAVMKAALSDPVKVLLTILRKLFMQRGTGRQYSALRRGLPPSLTGYVDSVIAAIKSNGFADDVYLDRKAVLIPNRSRSADALAIINGPNASSHPLIEIVRTL